MHGMTQMLAMGAQQLQHEVIQPPAFIDVGDERTPLSSVTDASRPKTAMVHESLMTAIAHMMAVGFHQQDQSSFMVEAGAQSDVSPKKMMVPEDLMHEISQMVQDHLMHRKTQMVATGTQQENQPPAIILEAADRSPVSSVTGTETALVISVPNFASKFNISGLSGETDVGSCEEE